MSCILIVEDRIPDRQFLASLFGYKGYQVVEAGDGAEALVKVRQWRPDLVISDLLMPTMDGYELVRRIREIPDVSDTRVIFYTATYHEGHARALAKECGALDVLTKPAEPQTILAAVESALSTSLRDLGRREPSPEFDREHARVINDKLADRERELKATEQRLSALVDTACELATQPSSSAIMQHVCESVRHMTLGSHALLGVLSSDGSAIERLLTSGLGAAAAARLEPPSIGNALIRTIIDGRRAVRQRNPDGQPETLGMPTSHPAVYSILGVPIASPSRVYGWLSVRNKLGGGEFTEADEHAALALGSLAGMVFENARLIEDLRYSDQRTRYALEAAHMGTFDVDVVSMRVALSETMLVMFGLSPEETPQNIRDCIALVHPDDRQRVDDAIAAAVRNDTDYFEEFRAPLKDGSIRWFTAQGRLFRDPNSARVRLIGVVADITDRKSAEQAIADQRLRVLKATMRTVQDIVGNAFSSMELLRLEAEGLLPAETLELFHNTMMTSCAQLRALGDLEDTPEKAMEIGVGIDFVDPTKGPHE